jgi:ABC-type sugar transport system permease subunit
VERRIHAIDVLPDGSLIAVSAGVNANKHNYMLYDAEGNRLQSIPIGTVSQAVKFLPDGSGVVMGTNRGELRLLDLDGEETARYPLDYEIVGMEYIASKGLYYVATKDATVTVLNTKFEEMGSVQAEGEGMSVGVSEDGRHMAIGTKEGFLYVFDEEGTRLFSQKLEYSVTGIQFSSGRMFVTGLGDFLYEMDETRLDTIVWMQSVQDWTLWLSWILPLLMLLSIIRAVPSLRRRADHFLHTLYKHRIAYILLAPTLILLAVFSYYPAYIALTRAFTDWSRNQSYVTDISFIGLDNFRLMLEEGYFLIGLKNLGIIIATTFLKVLTVPLLVAKLVFAMLGNRARYWYRFLFVVPMVVPGVVSALMWVQIYDPTIGLINQTLLALGLDNWVRVWLGDASTAIWAVVFMGFPFIDAFAFLVYYGGLINIPSELFEAAKVDGSNPIRDFTRIQLPLLTPQFKLLIVLSFIGAIQNFTGILLLTSGGPGSATYVPGLELYYNATRFGRYGYACALGVVMFIAIMLGTLINLRIKSNEAME